MPRPGRWHPQEENKKNQMRTVSLTLVALLFCAAIGQLLYVLLALLLAFLLLPPPLPEMAAALAGSAYAVSYFSIIVGRRLCSAFLVTGLVLALLLTWLAGLDLWLALPLACIVAAPLLQRPQRRRPWLERPGVIHQMHNLQTLAILFGMGLSVRFEALRPPLLLTIASGMLHWHPRLVGACPLTLLEARLTRDPHKAAQLAELGFFQFYLRHWSGRLVTRPQINAIIITLLSAMLGQWMLG